MRFGVDFILIICVPPAAESILIYTTALCFRPIMKSSENSYEPKIMMLLSSLFLGLCCTLPWYLRNVTEKKLVFNSYIYNCFNKTNLFDGKS